MLAADIISAASAAGADSGNHPGCQHLCHLRPGTPFWRRYALPPNCARQKPPRKPRLNKEKKRISELDTIIKKLYESFAVGRITGERFDSLLAEYEAEQKALTASVSEMETQMSAFAEDTDRAKQFLELAKKYTDFSELTTPMINEFVEKIIVHAPGKD